ncbi:hypothetical protein OIO90_002384 [Microbotryomycetes sp. JL221]|nr:hypothetical protein OIO90_002384 [Microbotryomycetes sp. JL221]
MALLRIRALSNKALLALPDSPLFTIWKLHGLEQQIELPNETKIVKFEDDVFIFFTYLESKPFASQPSALLRMRQTHKLARLPLTGYPYFDHATRHKAARHVNPSVHRQSFLIDALLRLTDVGDCGAGALRFNDVHPEDPWIQEEDSDGNRQRVNVFEGHYVMQFDKMMKTGTPVLRWSLPFTTHPQVLEWKQPASSTQDLERRTSHMMMSGALERGRTSTTEMAQEEVLARFECASYHQTGDHRLDSVHWKVLDQPDFHGIREIWFRELQKERVKDDTERVTDGRSDTVSDLKRAGTTSTSLAPPRLIDPQAYSVFE